MRAFVVAATLLWLAACSFDAAPAPGDTAVVDFVVPKGASARGIGDELAAAGLVASASDWEWFLRFGADGSCLKAGKHRAARAMTAGELLAALCGPPVPDDVPFTVVEGWRAKDIDAALVEKGLVKPGEYLAATLSGREYRASYALPTGGLEGYLYPETYRVAPADFTAKAFVQRQLDLLGERFANATDPRPRSLHQVVIVASMIEREEPSPANRGLVAGIMWKRLDANWNLGIDATSRYTLADWNDERAFLKQLFDPSEPYNTRLRPGLPPTAIGSPGIRSLEAALHPEATEYWYYLHDATGTIHPARSAEDHEKLKRKYL
ncbi:MAG: endolytic transglycosylase MltG [Myxococcales bacterium]|nr:endolytic transglycosylase MltG [Myxococcales bacterium]